MKQQWVFGVVVAVMYAGSVLAQGGGPKSSGEGNTQTLTIPGQSVTPQGVPGTTTPPTYTDPALDNQGTSGTSAPGQSVTPQGVPGTTGSTPTSNPPDRGSRVPGQSVTPEGVPGTSPSR
ncbi:MAG TPA: hypothetical protein VKT70_03505 [Stellaceae bacterium]|nr:hypothetical protein [Stellaceae bacterium]